VYDLARCRRPGQGDRRAGDLDTTEVREWAMAVGIEIKDPGCVSAAVVGTFRAVSGK
jgi:hypothetical protein